MYLFCHSKGSCLSVPKDDLTTLSFMVVVDAYRTVTRLVAKISWKYHVTVFRPSGQGQEGEDLASCLFLFSEIFCSLSSPGGTASHGEAAEQGARWSPSFAHPCGAFSHRSMIYSLWSSLDQHAPMLTPQKGLLCSVPSLCTAASSPSPAFEEG